LLIITQNSLVFKSFQGLEELMAVDGKLRILIVDDDPDITETLASYFTEKGDICTVYDNGIDGLEAMNKDTFDVVLLDLSMPEFSGFDALKALAYKEILRKQQVFVITALEISPESEKLMTDAGVIKVVRKPFSPHMLSKMLENYRKKNN
jgi:DNA-binding response OmpR family regulator